MEARIFVKSIGDNSGLCLSTIRMDSKLERLFLNILDRTRLETLLVCWDDPMYMLPSPSICCWVNESTSIGSFLILVLSLRPSYDILLIVSSFKMVSASLISDASVRVYL